MVTNNNITHIHILFPLPLFIDILYSFLHRHCHFIIFYHMNILYCRISAYCLHWIRINIFSFISSYFFIGSRHTRSHRRRPATVATAVTPFTTPRHRLRADTSHSRQHAAAMPASPPTALAWLAEHINISL